jgi:bacteriocin-like protein
MSDEKPIESKNAAADALTKQPGDVQLNEEELKQVSGGGALHNGTHIPKVIIELTRPTGKSPQ